MNDCIVLGIDAGGTHTDAALLALEGQPDGKRPAPRGGTACTPVTGRLLALAKTPTRHEDLPASIREVLAALADDASASALLPRVERVTLGTTLAVNALVQGRADPVGLALAAGPGLDPRHFVLGDHVCVVPGGLDHRGEEVARLDTGALAAEAAAWPAQGVAAVACVGKFSPRNPRQETLMGEVAARASGLPVTLGHRLSGRLNFPRRIATAYYNAAVARIQARFLDAVEAALAGFGIRAPVRLLKADGGAATLAIARGEPVQSILSGPAASVMGVMALWPGAAGGCSLLLDMGGTTTDIALFHNGSPVVDRDGMLILGRRTLVRSLASVSIGVGGDSLLRVERADSGIGARVRVGPERQGAAMAFGGTRPTLLDALNTLAFPSVTDDARPDAKDRGDVAASRRGLAALACAGSPESGAASCENPERAMALADMAVADAIRQVTEATRALVERVNSGPIYTLAALKAAREARPGQVCLVGGPAQCVQPYLEAALGLPVTIAPHAAVANAIGAAVAQPTAGLEVYADTGRGVLSAPALGVEERIDRRLTLREAEERAMALLKDHLAGGGVADADVEVVEADLFATLDDAGRGSRDMRVACQVRPGIAARVAS